MIQYLFNAHKIMSSDIYIHWADIKLFQISAWGQYGYMSKGSKLSAKVIMISTADQHVQDV